MIDNMRMMFEIKWDIVDVLCKENDILPERMSIAHFIKDILISASHICNNYISLCNLIVDSLKNTTLKVLLIYPFAVSTNFLTSNANP